MNVTVQTPDTASTPAASPTDNAEASRPCVDAQAVVLETSADQSWTDFCRSLRRPALLLGDVDEASSEQP